nr:hypothetical protein [Suaeda aralocaspica]
MALEAALFSQDPLITSNNWCTSSSNNSSLVMNYDYFFSNYYSSKLLEDSCLKVPTFNVGLTDNIYHFSNNILPTTTTTSQFIPENNNDVPHWNEHHYQYGAAGTYSSPEDHVYLSGEAPPSETTLGGTRNKRRRRSCKNKEEVEQQRMTHIAVERNRRKQMNDYLAVIRSLMPTSYVQRGDQASIVGGAINYVKELEQVLQSIEAQKHKRHDQQPPPPSSDSDDKSNVLDGCTPETAAQPPAQLFADFFSFPQYSTRCSNKNENSPTRSLGCNSMSSSNSGVAEIEVSMVESHANVKILAKKQPKQLVKLIAGFQGLRLNVLHLNVTTVDSFVLYSFSLKVEEGCQLNSIDDIAVASNHIVEQIHQEEAADHLL